METRHKYRPASENGGVTMETEEFRAHADLDAELLEGWIEAGWLIPASREGLRNFSEVDLARAQLIKDLHDLFCINDEGIAVVLHLIDQLHGLRHTLDSLMSALSAQPEEVQLTVATDILAAIESRTAGETRAKTGGRNSRHDTRSRERRFT
jgi:chaperone modulatory protein CbpM